MINVKKYRNKAGITQKRLAELLGVGQSTVAMWEAGENLPCAGKLPKLAKILGCSVDDLFRH